jgi:hypothetical protein
MCPTSTLRTRTPQQFAAMIEAKLAALETAAIAEFRALAAGRADLLAEVADILDGTPDGELD